MPLPDQGHVHCRSPLRQHCWNAGASPGDSKAVLRGLCAQAAPLCLGFTTHFRRACRVLLSQIAKPASSSSDQSETSPALHGVSSVSGLLSSCGALGHCSAMLHLLLWLLFCSLQTPWLWTLKVFGDHCSQATCCLSSLVLALRQLSAKG